jgi:hypothetical protein
MFIRQVFNRASSLVYGGRWAANDKVLGVRSPEDLYDEHGKYIGRALWNEHGAHTTIGGVRVPRRVTFHMPGDDTEPALRMTFNMGSGAAMCTAVQLQAKRGKAIRAKDARAAARVLLDWGDDLVEVFTRTRRNAHRPQPRTVTDQLLAEVAEIYRGHLGSGPTRAVAAHRSVPYSTAARYVTQARRAGFLPPTTPGKKRA